MKRFLAVPLALLVLGAAIDLARAHCQVPCGIYDDGARIAQLREDAVTIEKAIAQINSLAGQSDPQSANQLVRWIDTKEWHATNVIEIVSAYFLTQKVKPISPEDEVAYAEYLESLRDHHLVMVMAMKCKQSTDPGVTGLLQEAIGSLAHHYSTE